MPNQPNKHSSMQNNIKNARIGKLRFNPQHFVNYKNTPKIGKSTNPSQKYVKQAKHLTHHMNLHI